MKRQAINPPNDWGASFEMNQAEKISEYNEVVFFSGQTALCPDEKADMGLSVRHPGDFGGQMKYILETIDKLLATADMTRSNIVHIRFFTTNMSAFLENYGVYSEWIKEAGIRPSQSAIGINQLVMPELLLEIEVTAAQ